MNKFTTYQKRLPLAEQLPLSTPFSLHICASSFCNFKCVYCVHSFDSPYDNCLANGLKRNNMTLDTYYKIIDQLCEFPGKLKLLNFAYLGEPLLNQNIAEMVKYAKSKDVAERIEIVTNASLLTKDLSEKLIDAKLDRLRISIQGLNAEEYFQTSKAKIEFSSFVENIKYLYELSAQNAHCTQIYIKTVDSVVQTKDRQDLFYDIFSPICHNINIEGLIPLYKDCNLSEMKKDFEITFWNENILPTNLCAEVFYTLVADPEGNIQPCCTMEKPPLILGNIHETSLLQIWNGETLRNFRLNMLQNGYNSASVHCKNCSVPVYQTAPSDYLDSYKDELISKYSV